MIASTRGLIALALVAAAACSGDEGAGPAGSIAISASPTATTLSQGGTGTISVTIARIGGFSEPVTISVSGLPDGVTATVAPAQLTTATSQAQVTLSVSDATVPGTYTATVNATASGVASAVATYSLVVTARPSFTLSAAPGAMSIHQGESATSEIHIARTNFPAAVSLALLNPPTGITGQLGSPALGTNASLTVYVSGTVAPGTYPLTIVGSADGLVDRTASLTITVTERPDYSLSVSPASVSINAASSAQVTVTISRTNFTGAVDLALQSSPPGISGSFSASGAGGSTLTITVAGSVAPGTYGLTIRGSATGFPDKNTTLTISVAPQPDYTLSVTPGSLSITSGGTGQVTVNIQRTNFTGLVNLSFDAAPNGISPAVNPTQTTGNSATLTVSVSSTVTPGSYSLTIKGGTGQAGAMDRSATLALTVTAPPPPTEPQPPPPPPPPPPLPPGGVGALSATPSTLSVGPGGIVTTLVALAGTVGPVVQFSVLAAPAGIVGTFSSVSASSNYASSTLTITVAANVNPGTYSIELQGTSSTLTRSATLTVSVFSQSSFTLSALPVTTGYQGYAHSVAIQIHRTNFSAAVSFQLEGTMPPGVTHSWYENPTLTNVGILRLVFPSDLPLGTYNFTVRGSAAGYADQTATFQVAVAQYSYFFLVATPGSEGSYKGGTVVSTISVDRINFTGDIALSVSPAPYLTGTLSSTLLTASSPTSTLTINVPANLQVTGGMSITVRAQSDTIVQFKSVTVLVGEAPISSLLVPQSVSIKQGTSGTITVNPVRGLYIGPVDLSVTGAPTGMSVSFAQNPVSGYATTTSTISVGAGVPVGQYVLTFTGSAPGGVPVSSQVTVSVTP